MNDVTVRVSQKRLRYAHIKNSSSNGQKQNTIGAHKGNLQMIEDRHHSENPVLQIFREKMDKKLGGDADSLHMVPAEIRICQRKGSAS